VPSKILSVISYLSQEINAVITRGETIEGYPDDRRYPDRLVLGWRGRRPVHVVVAQNLRENELIVITVYEPDPELWEADFRRRKA
jgi:hypothetical protein